jgi:hypothetical protein
MAHVSTAIVAFKTITLGIGALISYFTLKAYRRTGAPQLRALTVGFAVVTLGALMAGVLDQLAAGLGRNVALAVESLFTMVGFAVILYSLYVE